MHVEHRKVRLGNFLEVVASSLLFVVLLAPALKDISKRAMITALLPIEEELLILFCQILEGLQWTLDGQNGSG